MPGLHYTLSILLNVSRWALRCKCKHAATPYKKNMFIPYAPYDPGFVVFTCDNAVVLVAMSAVFAKSSVVSTKVGYIGIVKAISSVAAILGVHKAFLHFSSLSSF